MFPDWAAEMFQEVGPLLVETDADLSPEEMIDLIDDRTQEVRSFAEDVYQEWHDHGRVWEHPDGTVRVTTPEELDLD